MNGRLYDAEIGRFLQADLHVQFADNSQSYNRYSYVLNNPLSLTDPSGYLFGGLKKFVKKYWRIAVATFATYMTAGALSGWGVSYIVGQAAGSMAVGNIVAGIATGAISGAVGGTIASRTLKGALKGAFSGVVFGGIGASGLGDTSRVAAHALADQ